MQHHNQIRRAAISAILSGLAAPAAAATFETLDVDPIYAAIENHRLTFARFVAAIGNNADNDPATKVAAATERQACDALVWGDIDPTTVAGVAALLRYITKGREETGDECFVVETDDMPAFLHNIAEVLERMA